jgi:hypothetical protein
MCVIDCLKRPESKNVISGHHFPMEASVMRVKFYDFDDSTMHIEENIKDSKSLKRCDGKAIIINGGKLTCPEQLCGTDVCCQDKNCILPLPAIEFQMGQARSAARGTTLKSTTLTRY